MPGPDRPTAAARPALRLVGLLVVVAGLFGMHGLAGHGLHLDHDVPSGSGPALAAPYHADAVTHLAAAAAGSGHEAMAMAAPAVGLDSTDPAPTGLGMGMTTGMGMGSATMCVAILGVALLLILRRTHRERSFAPTNGWPDPRRTIVHPGRPPAPPSLTLLSVRRC